jgi:hypothetical protein
MVYSFVVKKGQARFSNVSGIWIPTVFDVRRDDAEKKTPEG